MDPEQYQQLIGRVSTAVEEHIPPGSNVLVVSRGDEELLRHQRVSARHFPQTRSGRFAGFHPSTSESAIQHLEKLRRRGATHLVLPSTAFWWLEHYRAFRDHLQERYATVHADDNVIIYHVAVGADVYGSWPVSSTADVARPPFEAMAPGYTMSQSDRDADGAYVEQVLSVPTHRDDAYVEYLVHSPVESSVKVIAFYLPQFHPIPENDLWWGKGFTEWTNVSKAVPQFVGHYQPRLPGELGFYDLRLPEIQRAQVALARNYGVHGFCFHFYWFNGRRLLERPLEAYLQDQTLDLPFCISWANENWTRRWDGLDDEVLLEQKYSADDDVAWARSVSPILRDSRYIKVAGKPLVVVYRPSLMKDTSDRVARWRATFTELGVGDVFLVCAQFDAEDPRPFGFDAAVEFPPHKIGWTLPLINDQLEVVNRRYGGRIHDYAAMVDVATNIPTPPYSLIRGVTPSWDNEARKPGKGTTFHGSTPETYSKWLLAASHYAKRHPIDGESLVFLNAWNEWAEGAYVEPDRRFGFAYLEATRSALVDVATKPAPRSRLLLVVHDAYNHGAQQNALHIAKALSERFKFALDIILLGAGELRHSFSQYGELHDFAAELGSPEQQAARLRQIRGKGVDIAIVNSAASGRVVPMLKEAGFKIETLVHELPSLLREYDLHKAAAEIGRLSDVVVFPADFVQNSLKEMTGSVGDRARVRPQGLYRKPAELPATERARRSLKAKLDLPEQSKVALAVGWADLRKGIDLFMRVAARVHLRDPDAVFVWLGCEDPDLRTWYTKDAEVLGFDSSLHLLPRVENVSDYYAAADVLLLPSREDPFPSVVLEALSHSLPVVAFEAATGAGKLLESGAGVLVPYADTDKMADAVMRLLHDDRDRHRLGRYGHRMVQKHYAWEDYIYDLISYLGEERRQVSVIVPNFNYGPHLEQRLHTIFDQTYPVRDVIVLDDASTDDSMATLERLRDRNAWDFSIARNNQNSGSVFKQWLKGVRMARGELVWIAEADDYADENFLERLVPCFDSGNTVLAYAQSRQVDTDGTILANDYLEYVSDVDPDKWRQSWVRSGMDELASSMFIKNTIPNVSAVLFDKARLRSVLTQHMDFISSFRVAGDWAVYLHALLGDGDIAFIAQSLNNHRRHDTSVTKSAFGSQIVGEIERMQRAVMHHVTVGRDGREKASRYLTALRDQFGLRRLPRSLYGHKAPAPDTNGLDKLVARGKVRARMDRALVADHAAMSRRR